MIMSEEKKKTDKSEFRLRDLWDTSQQTNIRSVWVPEEERKAAERISEDIMTEKFPELVKDTNINTQETQQTPNNKNSKRHTPRYTYNQMYKS